MIPHARERVADWLAARRRAGRMLVALDFDGTLADIVADPAVAALHATVEPPLRRLAARPDTDVAIVSGRALEDVRARVPIPELYLAGNHGLEIEGPGVSQVHREAASVRPQLVRCATELRRRLGEVPGVETEDKGLSLSVHYRRAVYPEEAGRRVRALLEELCGGDPRLRLTAGKMVHEVRPAVDWDKGRATAFLQQALRASHGSLVPTIFIGDDVTDEDAFRVVAADGAGVLVTSELPGDTAATTFVRSPREVAELLATLAA